MKPKTKIILNYLYIGIAVTAIRYLDRTIWSWSWIVSVLLFVVVWAAIDSLRNIAYRQGLKDGATGWKAMDEDYRDWMK